MMTLCFWRSVMWALLGTLLALATGTCRAQGQPDGAEVYRFDGGALTVRVVETTYESDPHAARVRWGAGRARHSQYLTLPRGWWPTTRYGYAGSEALPCVLLWRAGRTRLLVLVAACSSGVYDYRCPIVYHLHAGQWEQVSSTKAQEFSNRGSFDIQGHVLRVWDYEADWSRAHLAPQRYWLREFVWERGRLWLWRSRMTRRRYPSFDAESDIHPQVSAEYDPLCEFGLRWRWWGRLEYIPDAP
jgi:hypothetical protein